MSFLRGSFDRRSYFPPVWFAEGDESAVPEEELRPIEGYGGRVVTQYTKRAVEYDKFKFLREQQAAIEEEDEEIILVLVQMVGELYERKIL